MRVEVALTPEMYHIIVSRVKTASIRELKHNTTTVLGWVSEGQDVEIRRHGKPVAVLSRPPNDANWPSDRIS